MSGGEHEENLREHLARAMADYFLETGARHIAIPVLVSDEKHVAAVEHMPAEP
jgi:hypothetical protein